MGRVKQRGSTAPAGKVNVGRIESRDSVESPGNEISFLREESKTLKAKLAAISNEVRNLRNDNMVLRSENEDLRNQKSQRNTLPLAVLGPQQQRQPQNNERYVIHSEIQLLSDVEVLLVGLSYCGFDAKRQKRVNLDRNIKRFKSFFGVPPTTVAPILKDLKDNNPNLIHKDSLMAMNWLYLYETREVLSGRWGPNENNIGTRVMKYGKEIQKLRRKKIKFEFKVEGEYLATLDSVNFLVQEFRLDPSAKWFDPKSHSAGLKYEFGLAIEEPKQVWLNGPFIPSTADVTAFRGGKTDTSEDEWDKTALYFQVPKGKKLLGDKGYAGEPTKIATNSREYPKEMREWIGKLLARQETLHTRLKSFNILGHRFRHGVSTQNKMDLHKMAVEAVAVIVQFDYEHGHPPFDG